MMVVMSPAESEKQENANTFADTGRVSNHDAELLKNFLHNIYDGVALCDVKGRIIDANERLLSFINYSLDELKGRSILTLLSGADPLVIDTINNSLRSNRHVLINAYGRRNNGTIFPAEISANHLQTEPTLLCFFIRDITVRKQSEDLLRTGYNAITNCLSGIAVADPMGIIVYANPAALNLWGCKSENELKGQSILNIWEDTAKARHMIDTIMDSDRGWNGDLTARRMDRSNISLHVAAACNLDDDNEATGMVFSFVDISDRLRADEASREAEARQAMLASLAAACHHLGQPATVLLTSLGMLKETHKNADPDTRMLQNSAYDAAIQLSEVLKKLSRTNKYQTTDYLKNSDPNASFNKMLDIE
ncbi:MAG TPA: PAS domain-containing protein [Kiritimatiellia bacterium]|nr:PAS domain-containing protein [Kiritimatiellia bacterium]